MQRSSCESGNVDVHAAPGTAARLTLLRIYLTTWRGTGADQLVEVCLVEDMASSAGIIGSTEDEQGSNDGVN